jgi:hypothetical protein
LTDRHVKISADIQLVGLAKRLDKKISKLKQGLKGDQRTNRSTAIDLDISISLKDHLSGKPHSYQPVNLQASLRSIWSQLSPESPLE